MPGRRRRIQQAAKADSDMVMHTYRRRDGSYYDEVEPESEDDEPLPLRPSEVHKWDGRRWVWRGKNITHSFPRSQDVCDVSPERLRDIVELVHEIASIVEYQGRSHGEMRSWMATQSQKLEAHLEDAKPLMETIQGLRAVSKAAGTVASIFNGITSLLKFVWRFGIVVIAIYGAIWALMHGDLLAFKRAFGLVVS